jgi:hypothetical protein
MDEYFCFSLIPKKVGPISGILLALYEPWLSASRLLGILLWLHIKGEDLQMVGSLSQRKHQQDYTRLPTKSILNYYEGNTDRNTVLLDEQNKGSGIQK